MMRCSTVRALLDRYADGRLAPDAARLVSAHLASCNTCVKRFAVVQGLLGILVSPATIRAPERLRGRVMEEVYRLGMAGYPRQGVVDDRDAQRGRFYRRLGLTFMLSAALLAVSLVIPRASYPTIFASAAVATDLSPTGARVVRMTLTEADRVVRGTLMKPEGPFGGKNGGHLR